MLSPLINHLQPSFELLPSECAYGVLVPLARQVHEGLQEILGEKLKAWIKA